MPSAFVSDLRDLYTDDVEAIYTAMHAMCDTVVMESREYSNITLANITDIKQEKLTEFVFRGTNPKTILTVGQGHSSFLTVRSVSSEALHFFRHLRNVLEERRRPINRLLRVPGEYLWFGLAGLALVAVPILGEITPLPLQPAWGVFIAIALLVLPAIRISFAPASPPVVYPVWKRQGRPMQHINWRERILDALQGLLLLILGFLLGNFL
jgi:hypothetical protein